MKASRNTSRTLDRDLTDDDMEVIARARQKYAGNLPAFAKDHLRVVSRQTGKLIPLELNEGQLALHTLVDAIGKFNIERTTADRADDPRAPEPTHLPIKVRVLKARKVGFSTYIQARGFHACEFNPHTNVLVMAHKKESAGTIAQMARRFHQFFTPELDFRMEIVRNAGDILEWHPNWDSRLLVSTAGSDGGTARAKTFGIVHISEEAWFPPGSDEVAAAENAALDFPEIYHESTANGVSGTFYDGWKKSMYFEDVVRLWRNREPWPAWWNGEFKFFWGWWQDPNYTSFVPEHQRARLEADLTSKERGLIEDYGLDIHQIQWRRNKIANECSKQTKVQDPEAYFDQEYPDCPEGAFISSGRQVFNQKLLGKMEAAAEERKPRFAVVNKLDRREDTEDRVIRPQFEVRTVSRERDATLTIFEEPKTGWSYVAGIDVAEGLERGDWSVMSIWNRTDGGNMYEAARYRAKTDSNLMGEIADYLGRMYNDAFLVPEGKSPGNATCLRLIQLEYPALYHSENPEHQTDADPEGFTAGFKTYSNTKRLLVENAQHALREGQILICHKESIRQWRIFEMTGDKPGSVRCSAPDGENDDDVMADMLALYGHQAAAPPVFLHPKQIEVAEEIDPELSQDKELWEKIKKLKERATKRHDKLELSKKKSFSLRFRSGRIDPFY